jgi:hypothetical protein
MLGSLALTSGPRPNALGLETVFTPLPAMPQLTDAVIDKGEGSDQIRQRLQSREVVAVGVSAYAAVVPEPGFLLIPGAGLAAVGICGRKRFMNTFIRAKS